MIENQTKGHRLQHIFAGIVDYVVVYLVVMTLISVTSTIFRKNYIELYSQFSILVTVFFPLIISGVYHIYLSNDLRIISIGESFAGKEFNDGKVIWINPYKISRKAIYFVTLINLISISFLWWKLYQGFIFSFTGIVAGVGKIIFIFYVLKLVNHGKPKGLLIFIAFSMLAIINFLFVFPFIETKNMYIIIHTIYILIYSIIYFIYRNEVSSDIVAEYYFD